MVMIWPFIHAFLAAIITTWDVLPPTSKAYDLVPTHIQAKLGRNATLDKVVKEWVRDTWRWGEPALNPSVALTWVNGINYTSAEVEEQAHFLSTLFGCRVRPYYNPSLGWWLKDLTRVSYMYIRSPTEDPVVTGLAKHLSMVLREVGPTGRVVHLAHSGGALLTYLVAKYHLKAEDRSRIDVINFGGARSITQKYFAKATNYYARNDPILLVNRRAMALMQQVLRNETDGEVIYLKHNTSFVFLQGRAGDALTDHSLVGPTYLTALQREAAVFRRAYYRAYWLEALKIAKPPEMGWGRYLRKRTAAATGFHNFFSNSTLARRLTDSTAYRYLAYPYSASALYNSSAAARQSANATAAYVLRLPRRAFKGMRKRVRRALAWSGLQAGSNVSATTALAAAGAAAAAAGVAANGNRSSWFPSLPFFATSAPAPTPLPVEEELPPSGPPSLLSTLSNVSISTEEVALRVRRVRKAAARLTGMRAFFSKEKRLRKLVEEGHAPLLAIGPGASQQQQPPVRPEEPNSSGLSWGLFRGTRRRRRQEEEEDDGPLREGTTVIVAPEGEILEDEEAEAAAAAQAQAQLEQGQQQAAPQTAEAPSSGGGFFLFRGSSGKKEEDVKKEGEEQQQAGQEVEEVKDEPAAAAGRSEPQPEQAEAVEVAVVEAAAASATEAAVAAEATVAVPVDPVKKEGDEKEADSSSSSGGFLFFRGSSSKKEEEKEKKDAQQQQPPAAPEEMTEGQPEPAVPPATAEQVLPVEASSDGAVVMAEDGEEEDDEEEVPDEPFSTEEIVISEEELVDEEAAQPEEENASETAASPDAAADPAAATEGAEPKQQPSSSSFLGFWGRRGQADRAKATAMAEAAGVAAGGAAPEEQAEEQQRVESPSEPEAAAPVAESKPSFFFLGRKPEPGAKQQPAETAAVDEVKLASEQGESEAAAKPQEESPLPENGGVEEEEGFEDAREGLEEEKAGEPDEVAPPAEAGAEEKEEDQHQQHQPPPPATGKEDESAVAAEQGDKEQEQPPPPPPLPPAVAETEPRQQEECKGRGEEGEKRADVGASSAAAVTVEREAEGSQQ